MVTKKTSTEHWQRSSITIIEFERIGLKMVNTSYSNTGELFQAYTLTMVIISLQALSHMSPVALFYLSFCNSFLVLCTVTDSGSMSLRYNLYRFYTPCCTIYPLLSWQGCQQPMLQLFQGHILPQLRPLPPWQYKHPPVLLVLQEEKEGDKEISWCLVISW